MAKDTKQRLFETMKYVNPDFIVESKVYVKATEVPSQILSWARSYLGKGFENKITIERADGKVQIGMPWHDADKETHQFFKLTPDGAQMAGDPVSKTGWSEMSMYDDPYGAIEIPSGFILATTGTYPKRLKLTVSDDAMNLMPDTQAADEISDEALVALHQAHVFKSSYRQKFGDQVYQELVAKGLMKPNKAITIDGRNLITSETGKQKLKAIKTKDQEENGTWNTKYKFSNI